MNYCSVNLVIILENSIIYIRIIQLMRRRNRIWTFKAPRRRGGNHPVILRSANKQIRYEYCEIPWAS
jgi:hypothetical protein